MKDLGVIIFSVFSYPFFVIILPLMDKLTIKEEV